MAYTVTTFDLCVQGFERLRRHSEFILCAYPHAGETPSDLESEWLADIQACMREDGFDYDAAEAAVKEFVAENLAYLGDHLNGIEPTPEGDESDNPLTAFLYVETGR